MVNACGPPNVATYTLPLTILTRFHATCGTTQRCLINEKKRGDDPLADIPKQDLRKRFLRPKEAAEILRVKPKTLANWRSLGKGPDWRRHGGLIVYEATDVFRFSDEQMLVG